MNPKPARPVLLLVALLAWAPAPAAAQAPEGAVRLRRAVGALGDSARVRVLAPGVMVYDGLFLGLRSDSLVVADADARFSVGLDEIEGLSVEGSRWLEVGLQAGAVGLVAGAAAGYFLGYLNCGDTVQHCGSHARGVGVRWGLVFGSAGFLGGGMVGSRIRRWERVFP